MLLSLGLLDWLYVWQIIKKFCCAAESQRKCEERFCPIGTSLKQLDNMEQNLEILSTQVQAMKDSLSRSNKKEKEDQMDKNFKLSEIGSSFS